MINVLSLTHLTALDCFWRWLRGQSFLNRLQFPECNSSQKAGQQRKYRCGKFLLLPQVVGREKKIVKSARTGKTDERKDAETKGRSNSEEGNKCLTRQTSFSSYFTGVFCFYFHQLTCAGGLKRIGRAFTLSVKWVNTWEGAERRSRTEAVLSHWETTRHEGDWIIWGRKKQEKMLNKKESPLFWADLCRNYWLLFATCMFRTF